MPSHLLASIFIVELTMACLTIAIVVRSTMPTALDFIRAATLAAVAILATEIGKQIERRRVRFTVPHHIDFSGVWTFCATLVLPLTLTIPCVAVIQFHLWARTGWPRVPYYRSAFTMTTVLLACVAASFVRQAISPELSPHNVVGVVLALLVYTTVNTGLVSGAIAMSSPQPSLAVTLGTLEDHLMEVATLSMGAMAATAILIHPAFALLILLPVVVLHRAAPLRQLQVAADTDVKTNLLNIGAWHRRSSVALHESLRAGNTSGLLIVDIDYFKRVNDRYGHLVGDHVLRAVAGALRAQTRDNDVVGRFGGEEFVVLLPNLRSGAPDELAATAERIRGFVAQQPITVHTADGPLTVGPLTVSVGGSLAVRPIDDELGLQELLRSADEALLTAKAMGRNQVRIAGEERGSAHSPQRAPVNP